MRNAHEPHPVGPEHPAAAGSSLQGQAKNGSRVVPSQYVTNGFTISRGLVLIMLAIFELPAWASRARSGPPLEPLEALQASSYQLLPQLTVVKSLLLLRRPGSSFMRT